MSLPSWARKGAKVVCVDARWDGALSHPVLVEREVYTVVGVENIPTMYGREGPFADSEIALVLLEVKHPDPFGRMSGFAIERFRPLLTLEDDMAAHFTRLLDVPAPTERERA